jgi:hypothetical protein
MTIIFIGGHGDMTRAEVEKYVNQNLDRLKAIMGLDEWNITVVYDDGPIQTSADGDFARGTCSPPLGKNGTIHLAVDAFDTEMGVNSTLCHELAHCVLYRYSEDLWMEMSPYVPSAVELGGERIIHKAEEELAEAIQRIANNFYLDRKGQVGRCLKHGCSVEATADICRVGLDVVHGVKAWLEGVGVMKYREKGVTL